MGREKDEKEESGHAALAVHSRRRRDSERVSERVSTRLASKKERRAKACSLTFQHRLCSWAVAAAAAGQAHAAFFASCLFLSLSFSRCPRQRDIRVREGLRHRKKRGRKREEEREGRGEIGKEKADRRVEGAESVCNRASIGKGGPCSDSSTRKSERD